MEEALELASKFGGVQDRQVHEEIAPYLKNLSLLIVYKNIAEDQVALRYYYKWIVINFHRHNTVQVMDWWMETNF